MTTPLFTADGSLLPLLAGALALLFATVKAVMQRGNLRGLILWGALHDAGVACMALAAQNPAGQTGFWLFLLFQIAARLLALTALARLAPSGQATHVDELRGAGRRHPWPGAFFALGLLAAVGGTPFLLPEARALIVQGLLEASPAGGMICLLLTAACGTVFIWLYVDAMRRVCLEEAPLSVEPAASGSAGAVGGLIMFVPAAAVATAGLLRAPLTEWLGAHFGLAVAHAPVHPAYWCFYAGAFIAGLAFLLRLRVAPLIAALFPALAFAAVWAIPSPPTARLFLLLIVLVALVVGVYSLGYIRDERRGWYWFFLLLTFASLAGIVSTPDTASMYGYWELMTFASYFLVVHEGRRTAFEAGLKYYVMCAGGALFMLPGLFLLGIFAATPQAAAQFPLWLQAALILSLAGFAAKAGLVPLHSWLPDAHPAAPSSVSAPLSGIITKMGVFGIVSVILINAGQATAGLSGLFGLSWFGTALTASGVATLVYGELMALRQNDIKRMLAYSTLGQIGEIALVLGLGTWLATAGALWHVLNHAVMKDLLFLGAGALIMRAGSRNLEDLRGLGRCMPWTVACMAVGLVSIMGLPPFGAFYSKFLMIQAAVHAGHIWLAALILIGSLVGAIYYTRILKTLVFVQRPAHLPEVQEAPFSMRLSLLVLAALSLLLGLAPQLPMQLVLPVASLCFAPTPGDPQIIMALSVYWPVYVLLPVFGALLPALFAGRRKPAGWTSVAVLLVTALLVALYGRDLDTLSFCFALIVPLIGALNMAYAVGYMEHSHSQWRFYCAFTCMCGDLWAWRPASIC